MTAGMAFFYLNLAVASCGAAFFFGRWVVSTAVGRRILGVGRPGASPPVAAPAPMEAALGTFRVPTPTEAKRRALRERWKAGESPEIVARLAETLADRAEPAVLRLECAAILFPRYPHKIEAAVARILRSPMEDAPMKTGLIRLLGDHGSEASVAPLLAALRSEDVHVMIAAELALRRLASRIHPHRLNLYAAVVRGLCLSIRNARKPWRQLRQLRILVAVERAFPNLPPSEQTVGVLTSVFEKQTLDNPYAEQAAAFAAEALGEFRVASALPALERALHIDSDLVRYKVVRAMALLGRKADITELGYIATHDFLRRIRASAVDSALAIHRRRPLPHASLP